MHSELTLNVNSQFVTAMSNKTAGDHNLLDPTQHRPVHSEHHWEVSWLLVSR